MFYLILVILILVIYASFRLSMKDYQKKNVCPKVLGIQARYLVFLFFAGAFIVHTLELKPACLYYGFLAIPSLLAIAGTLTELSGKEICPRTTSGRPMCYISFIICTLLITLKYFSF